MKTIASVRDISAEMQRRIDRSTWGGNHCADCSAPLPYRIPHDGVANWTANMAATSKAGCESFLLDVIASARRDYDLPSQTLGETVADLLSSQRRF